MNDFLKYFLPGICAWVLVMMLVGFCSDSSKKSSELDKRLTKIETELACIKMAIFMSKEDKK